MLQHFIKSHKNLIKSHKSPSSYSEVEKTFHLQMLLAVKPFSDIVPCAPLSWLFALMSAPAFRTISRAFSCNWWAASAMATAQERSLSSGILDEEAHWTCWIALFHHVTLLPWLALEYRFLSILAISSLKRPWDSRQSGSKHTFAPLVSCP